MQTRSYNHSHVNHRASARRRIRRTAGTHRLFCTTNGCATYLEADPVAHLAVCPICGARRTIN
jgi:hypothetical protein